MSAGWLGQQRIPKPCAPLEQTGKDGPSLGESRMRKKVPHGGQMPLAETAKWQTGPSTNSEPKDQGRRAQEWGKREQGGWMRAEVGGQRERGGLTRVDRGRTGEKEGVRMQDAGLATREAGATFSSWSVGPP